MRITTGFGRFVFAFAAFISVVTSTGANAEPVASRPTVLLVGDSITWHATDPNGWATRLQALYSRSVEVINRGQSGYNSRIFVKKALPEVSRELETSFAPVLITLWFGTNDAALVNGPAAKKHVPLEEYRSNLLTILNEFQRTAPQAKILVASPPVVDDARRRSRQVAAGGKSDPIDRNNAEAGVYAMACGDIVKSVNNDHVSFLDLHSFMMTTYENATSRAKLLVDGLHLSAEGNRVVFELVRDHLQPLMPTSALDG